MASGNATATPGGIVTPTEPPIDLSEIEGKGTRITINSTTLRSDGLRNITFSKKGFIPIKLAVFTFNAGIAAWQLLETRAQRTRDGEFNLPTDTFSIVSYGPAGFQPTIEVGADPVITEDPERKLSSFNFRQVRSIQ